MFDLTFFYRRVLRRLVDYRPEMLDYVANHQPAMLALLAEPAPALPAPALEDKGYDPTHHPRFKARYLDVANRWKQSHSSKDSQYKLIMNDTCHYMQFNNMEHKLHRQEDSGYKFHISLDMNDNNVYRGWEVVFPILAKYKISVFKVMPDGFDDDIQQRGKEITVYMYKNPDVKEITKETLKNILEEITYALITHNIIPGPFPNSPERGKEEKIIGSEYIAYRNDSGIDPETDPNNLFKGIDLTEICERARKNLPMRSAESSVRQPGSYTRSIS